MRHATRLRRLGVAAGTVSMLVLLAASPAAAEEPTVAHPDPDHVVSSDEPEQEYTTQVVDEDGEVLDPTAELEVPAIREEVTITGVDSAESSTGWAPFAAAGGILLLAGAGTGVALRRRSAASLA